MKPKQTEYLEGVLNYYRECDITIGDPNEGRWENAHTPLPRGMGDNTVPLLHCHHVIHDLWQSEWLNECHFYPSDAKKLLYSANLWPDNWFELCDIHDRLFSDHQRKVGSGNASASAPIRLPRADRTNREQGTGIYARGTASKGGKAIFEKGLGIFAPENLGKGCKNTNSQKWQCLVTGEISTPGPLTCFQKKRGIDTKLRKRIQ